MVMFKGRPVRTNRNYALLLLIFLLVSWLCIRAGLHGRVPADGSFSTLVQLNQTVRAMHKLRSQNSTMSESKDATETPTDAPNLAVPPRAQQIIQCKKRDKQIRKSRYQSPRRRPLPQLPGGYVQNIPETFAKPKSKLCFDFSVFNREAKPIGAPKGLEILFRFAEQNAIHPKCNIKVLRSWGGFPIPSDYCKSGPGTYFGTNSAGGENSVASYAMKEDMRTAVSGKILNRIAWIPSIRKCGSASLTKFFAHVKNTIGNIAPDSMIHPKVWNDRQIAELFFQFTVVRDPLRRFLSGAHQLFVFHYMGWAGGMEKKWGIEYGKRTCFDTNFGKDRNSCTPPYSTALDGLEAILDDIERVGFFNEHIAPMTYSIATSRGITDTDNHFLFDISSLSDLFTAMSRQLYNESESSARYQRANHHSMARHANPWIIRKERLLELSKTNCTAKRIVQRICRLYREDYACLPYKLPEACEGVVEI